MSFTAICKKHDGFGLFHSEILTSQHETAETHTRAAQYILIAIIVYAEMRITDICDQWHLIYASVIHMGHYYL